LLEKTIMLKTICITSAGLILLNASALAANTAASAPAAKADATPPAPAAADPSVIYQKNVFDPQRKPWNLPAEPVPAPPPPPPLTDADVKIQGVWETGGTRKALVELSPKLLAQFETKPGKTPRPYRTVSVGDNLGGFTLKTISAKELTFEQSGVTSTFKFQVAKGRATAGVSVAPPDQVAIVLSAPQPVVGDAGAAQPIAPAALPEPTPFAQPQAQPQSVPVPQQAADNAAAANNAAQPQAGQTTGAMGLLEAIEAARKNNSGLPVANPFAGLGK